MKFVPFPNISFSRRVSHPQNQSIWWSMYSERNNEIRKKRVLARIRAFEIRAVISNLRPNSTSGSKTMLPNCSHSKPNSCAPSKVCTFCGLCRVFLPGHFLSFFVWSEMPKDFDKHWFHFSFASPFIYNFRHFMKGIKVFLVIIPNILIGQNFFNLCISIYFLRICF